MKDIYSPLEIDEEWDNLAPVADGTAVVANPSTDVAYNPPLPELPGGDTSKEDEVKRPGTNFISAGEVTYDQTAPNPAYDAAEALIDQPASNTDTFNIADTSSSNSLDTSGLVKITPDEPTSGETTPETPSTDTPHEMIPVNVNVMGGEAAAANPELKPDPSEIIEDASESKSLETTNEPTIAGNVYQPVDVPAVDDTPKNMDSEKGDSVTPADSTDMIVPSGNGQADKADKIDLTQPKAEDQMPDGREPAPIVEDKAKKPSSTDASIHRLFPDVEPEKTDDLAGDKLDSILNDWEDSKRKIQNRLEEFRDRYLKDITNLEGDRSDLDAQIAKKQQEQADIVAKLKELDVL